MSMSFADVLPLPGVAGGSLQEGTVDLQKIGEVSPELAPALAPAPALASAPSLGDVALGGMSRRMAEQLGVSPVGVSGSLAAPGPVISSGFRELDRLLPSGGIRLGSLIEWLPAGGQQATGATKQGQEVRQPGMRQGSGVLTLALALAVQVARAAGVAGAASGGPTTVLVVDRAGWFYPPAVMRWLGAVRGQWQLPQCVVVRPSRDDDEVWAIDQALRCVGVAAVVACPTASVVCSSVMRRWQLAARGSGAVGMFVRPWQCRRDPSWAEVRLVAAPLRRSISSGRISPLRSPAVSPRSEAVLRCWRIERLSSVLYGEGVRCEIAIDLERGVEASPAGWQRPAQTPLHRQRSDGVLFEHLERRLQELSGKALLGKVFRKDGVACRAS